MDWERPYITQVARFDPSKGIPDVLLAYQKLYSKYIDAFLPPASDVRALVCMLSHLCLYSRSFSNHSNPANNRPTRATAAPRAGSASTRSCS